MTSWQRLKKLALEYKWRVSAFVLVGILQGVVGGGLVFLLREVLGALTSTDKIPPHLAGWLPITNPYSVFLFLIGCAVAVMFVKCFSMYLDRFLEGWLNNRIIMDMQNRLAVHMMGLDLAFFQRHRAGELLSRLTNDLQLMSRSIRLLCTLITKPLEISITLAAVFWMDWRLALLGMVTLPMGGAVYAAISRRLRMAARAAQEKRADLTSAMVQMIGGVRIIKAFTCEKFEAKQFRQETDRLYHVSMRFDRTVALIRPVNEFVAVMGSLIVLGVGGTWVYAGQMGPEHLFAFFGALGVMYGPAKELGRIHGDLQEVLVGVERVFQVLELKDTVVGGSRGELPADLTIKFENVTFSYVPGSPVLRGLDLTIPSGEVVALVGRTGSGKSTLADLAMRFHDPDSGRITLGGIDIREFSFAALRGGMALVNQDPFLFNAPIRDNIAYGRDDSDPKKMYAAARAAQIHDDILALPAGYDTVAGERGTNLSGGQRQRVSIARAIYKDSPILILDEATSALDAESEGKVQQALEQLLHRRTCLVIAHRLSTIRHADRIVMLEDGVITAEGRHEELMVGSSAYARLVKLQTETSEKADMEAPAL